jgi:ribose transport system permease protein
MTIDAATVAAVRKKRSTFARVWVTSRPFRPVLLVDVALFIGLAVSQPGFLTALNVQNILTSVSVLWVVSMAMTFVLISGGFDLSVGAIAGLCSVFLAKVLEAHLPGVPALLLTIAFGGLLGALLNGVFVGAFRLSVFVVTLASMTALSGVVLVWSQTQSIYVTAPIISQIAVNSYLGLQAPVWIMIGVFAVFLYAQNRTYFGRDLYATGGSFQAARLAGIRTTFTIVLVYAISGAAAGLGGAIGVGRVGAATPQVDGTIALQSIAAVLLGGTSLIGGSGSVTGTVFGVLFIGILQNGLNMAGVESSWQYIVTGVILLLAVLGDRVGRVEGGFTTRVKKAFRVRGDAVENACAVESADEE